MEATEPYLVASTRHGLDLPDPVERCRLGFSRQQVIGTFRTIAGDDAADVPAPGEPVGEDWVRVLEARFEAAQAKPAGKVKEFLSCTMMSMLESAFMEEATSEFLSSQFPPDPQRKLMHEERAEAMARYSKIDRICRLERLMDVFPEAIAAARANGRSVGRGRPTEYVALFPFERCTEWRAVPRQYARLLLGICREVLRARVRGQRLVPASKPGGLTWFDRTGGASKLYLRKPSAVASLLGSGQLVIGEGGLPEPSPALLHAAEAELAWQAETSRDPEEEPDI